MDPEPRDRKLPQISNQSSQWGGGRAEARPPSIQAMVPKPIKPGISGGIHWYQPASLEPSNSTEKTLR